MYIHIHIYQNFLHCILICPVTLFVFSWSKSSWVSTMKETSNVIQHSFDRRYAIHHCWKFTFQLRNLQKLGKMPPGRCPRGRASWSKTWGQGHCTWRTPRWRQGPVDAKTFQGSWLETLGCFLPRLLGKAQQVCSSRSFVVVLFWKEVLCFCFGS